MKYSKNVGRKVMAKLVASKETIRAKLAENNGQFVMDHAIQFAIALGIAIVVLPWLVNVISNDLGPAMVAKIRSFFG